MLDTQGPLKCWYMLVSDELHLQKPDSGGDCFQRLWAWYVWGMPSLGWGLESVISNISLLLPSSPGITWPHPFLVSGHMIWVNLTLPPRPRSWQETKAWPACPFPGHDDLFRDMPVTQTSPTAASGWGWTYCGKEGFFPLRLLILILEISVALFEKEVKREKSKFERWGETNS